MHCCDASTPHSTAVLLSVALSITQQYLLLQRSYAIQLAYHMHFLRNMSIMYAYSPVYMHSCTEHACTIHTSTVHLTVHTLWNHSIVNHTIQCTATSAQPRQSPLQSCPLRCRSSSQLCYAELL
jgi:hypothetical protein